MGKILEKKKSMAKTKKLSEAYSENSGFHCGYNLGNIWKC